jgi:HK97 family phage major capsid protein
MKHLDEMNKLLLEAKRLKEQKAESQRVNELVAKALESQMKALEQAPHLRKGYFNTGMAASGFQGGDKNVTSNLNKSLLMSAGKQDDLREFQKACDDVYALSIICNIHPTELETYKRLRESKIYKAAYDTADFSSTFWWPNTLSRDMIEEVERQLKLAAMFRVIQMPTNPYRIPSRTGRSKHYLVSETTGDDLSTNVVASSQGPMPGPVGITFEAMKLMSRVVISEETTEDMVLPILQMIQEDVAKSAAEAIEDAVVNGQTVAETIDTQAGYASNDAKRAWNGFRVHGLGGGWTQDLSSWTMMTDKTNILLLRKLRSVMGRYGLSPDALVWVVSINGYNNFLNIPEFLTPEKYGSDATLLTGELGRVDNIPVVISEFIPENLNASGAYTSDVDNDYTCVLLMYKDGWAHGERAKFTLKTAEEIKTDQRYLITRMRRDFKPLYMASTYADAILAVGYGLPNQLG